MAQHSLVSIPLCIEKYRTVTMSLSLESVNSKILSFGIFEGESKLQTLITCLNSLLNYIRKCCTLFRLLFEFLSLIDPIALSNKLRLGIFEVV